MHSCQFVWEWVQAWVSGGSAFQDSMPFSETLLPSTSLASPTDQPLAPSLLLLSVLITDVHMHTRHRQTDTSASPTLRQETTLSSVCQVNLTSSQRARVWVGFRHRLIPQHLPACAPVSGRTQGGGSSLLELLSLYPAFPRLLSKWTTAPAG